jgi:hypothetical protein
MANGEWRMANGEWRMANFDVGDSSFPGRLACVSSAMNTRIEKDSMGEMSVPGDALYGASTQRAVLNFPVSGRCVPLPVIHAYGLIKWAAACTHQELGLLPPDKTATFTRPALARART